MNENMLVERTSHCPFGCQVGESDDAGAPTMDDNGYCRHLVGFSNDGKSMEPVNVQYKRDPESGEDVPTGRKFVGGKLQPVLKSDKIVNPESHTKEGHLVKAWVSSRVYRDVKAVAKAS